MTQMYHFVVQRGTTDNRDTAVLGLGYTEDEAAVQAAGNLMVVHARNRNILLPDKRVTFVSAVRSDAILDGKGGYILLFDVDLIYPKPPVVRAEMYLSRGRVVEPLRAPLTNEPRVLTHLTVQQAAEVAAKLANQFDHMAELGENVPTDVRDGFGLILRDLRESGHPFLETKLMTEWAKRLGVGYRIK